MTIASLEELQAHARNIRGSWLGRKVRYFLSLFVEVLAIAVAGLLILFDIKLISLGTKLVVLEASNERGQSIGVFVQDPKLSLLLSLSYVGLFLAAVLLVLLQVLLTSARRRRDQIDLVCAGVEKLRRPKP